MLILHFHRKCCPKFRRGYDSFFEPPVFRIIYDHTIHFFSLICFRVLHTVERSLPVCGKLRSRSDVSIGQSSPHQVQHRTEHDGKECCFFPPLSPCYSRNSPLPSLNTARLHLSPCQKVPADPSQSASCQIIWYLPYVSVSSNLLFPTIPCNSFGRFFEKSLFQVSYRTIQFG